MTHQPPAVVRSAVDTLARTVGRVAAAIALREQAERERKDQAA